MALMAMSSLMLRTNFAVGLSGGGLISMYVYSKFN